MCSAASCSSLQEAGLAAEPLGQEMLQLQVAARPTSPKCWPPCIFFSFLFTLYFQTVSTISRKKFKSLNILCILFFDTIFLGIYNLPLKIYPFTVTVKIYLLFWKQQEWHFHPKNIFWGDSCKISYLLHLISILFLLSQDIFFWQHILMLGRLFFIRSKYISGHQFLP